MIKKYAIKHRKIIIIIAIIIFISLIFRLFFMSYYYDFREYWTLKDKIVWKENQKLIWSDFQYIEDANLEVPVTKLGLYSRFNKSPRKLIKSYTVFDIDKSKLSDTTDVVKLRMAQAKFDLLEIYRRKMEKEIDSLGALKLNNLDPSYFKNINQRYYNLFTKELEKYINSQINPQSLKPLEKKIQTELK